MLDFIEELYTNSNTIFKVQRAIQYFRSGYDFNISLFWDDIANDIPLFCSYASSINNGSGERLLAQFQAACALSTTPPYNYIQLADALDELIPEMYNAISGAASVDVSEDVYTFKSSRSGFLSLHRNDLNYRYHSLINPMWDAYEHAKRIYQPQYMSFHFLGCDLGYLPYQVYMLSDQSIDIYIYSLSQTAIDYAYDFGVLNWISPDKLHIIVDEAPKELLASFIHDRHIYFGKDKGYHIDKIILSTFSKLGYQHISDFNIQNESYSILSPLEIINSYRNMHNIPAWITSLNPVCTNSTCCIIAGGPSLDEQLPYIKDHSNDMSIICVSTVLSKLLNNGIHPDYVVATDPKKRTYNHFKELSDSSTTLVVSSTASWLFGEYYRGKKYLVPSDSIIALNEHFMANNIIPWNIGSTVSILAINLAIYLNAKTIKLFGLDLAFPNGVSHAKGTMDYKEYDTTKLISIKSVNNSQVYTNKQFMIYLQQIEDLISKYPDISFINYSDNGAMISGTQWFKN